MGRDRATSLLERQMDGTYLLRIRPQGPTHEHETIYALSLKYVYYVCLFNILHYYPICIIMYL